MSYYWAGFSVLLIMFIAVLNALLSIRSELRRMNDRMDVERRAARYERLFEKREP